MVRCHAIKVFFTISVSTMLFSLRGMENNQHQQNEQKKYTIFFNIVLNMFCSNTNEYGVAYLRRLNENDINGKIFFDCIKKPFTDKDISDFFGAITEEYFFKKQEISNHSNVERYGMQLSCSGKLCMNDIDDRVYYRVEEKYLSFLELAIIAVLKERKVDSYFNIIKSTIANYIFYDTGFKELSLQENIKKTICNELSYDPKSTIPIREDQDFTILKRYFPLLLLAPKNKKGKSLSAQLCNPLVVFDMFESPLLVPEIKDDNAEVMCKEFKILIDDSH